MIIREQIRGVSDECMCSRKRSEDLIPKYERELHIDYEMSLRDRNDF